MLSLGALSFAAPWALAGLVALPALWWLLRVTPPSPKRIVFPPLVLLATLRSREDAAARTPWWLLALRLTLAAALILGLARPVVDTTAVLTGSGPVFVLIDNGWGAAGNWQQRMAALDTIIDRAERQRRLVVLAPTARPGGELPVAQLVAVPARTAREAAHALVPVPWADDRSALVSLLIERARAAGWSDGAVFWISDGLAPAADAEAPAPMFERMRQLGTVTLVRPGAQRLPLLLASASPTARGLQVELARAAAAARPQPVLRMIADDDAPLARQPLHFEDTALQLTAAVDLPAELEARLARIEIEGEGTAGAVLLVDERWRRRVVGIVGEDASSGSPLLDGRYYVERAAQPFAEVRIGSVQELLARPLSMLVLTDTGTLDAETAAALQRWVEQDGGVLLRFAGPRLAREASAADPLLPVAIRAGERTIGGTLSWEEAGRPAAFSPSSPFHDLRIPTELRIERQVIAEPALDTAERTWAAMADGTPLITGDKRGEGWVVLVHTTASPAWSNLPLSGLFVSLLQRVADLSRTRAEAADAAVLPPLESLDGYGRLGAPPATARAIAGEDAASARAGPRHPPGFYGSPENRHALNLAPSIGTLRALDDLPHWVQAESLGSRRDVDLRAWLLTVALILAIADLVISLRMRGVLWAPSHRFVHRGSGAAVVLAVIAALPQAGLAETVMRDGSAEPASLTTRLAWVRSGDGRTDALSAAGLAGLSAVVNRRTAAELGPPVGVDPNVDELAFYPLLYWPLAAEAPPLTPAGVRRLGEYMRSGGTIVFDAGVRPESDRGGLRALAHALDLPPLVPLAEDHVLRRSYYLLNDLPGRRAGGAVWVERSSEHVNDGVSAVVAGAADWAGAWAVDDSQRPMLSVSPGGERQREHAYRFGINLVMYVLTGNYKADQVHLPTILERLAP